MKTMFTPCKKENLWEDPPLCQSTPNMHGICCLMDMIPCNTLSLVFVADVSEVFERGGLLIHFPLRRCCNGGATGCARSSFT
jgi:hypothetical protein